MSIGLVSRIAEEEFEESVEYLTLELSQLKKFILKHHPAGLEIF